MQSDGAVANILTQIWDVSNEALERDDTSCLWRLTLLTAAISILPLVLMGFLPRNAQDQDAVIRTPQRSSAAGAVGATFLLVLLVSITWAVVSAVQNISNSHPLHQTDHVMH